MRISDEARDAAKTFITEKYGEEYYPKTPRVYKSKGNNVQDAHEAIRPSNLNLEPAAIKKALTTEQYKLYKLIWDRFIASQMQSAELSTVQTDFNCEGYIFRTSGYTVKFPGYMALYEESTDDKNTDDENVKLPEMKVGDTLSSEKQLLPVQHFTEPPGKI